MVVLWLVRQSLNFWNKPTLKVSLRVLNVVVLWNLMLKNVRVAGSIFSSNTHGCDCMGDEMKGLSYDSFIERSEYLIKRKQCPHCDSLNTRKIEEDVEGDFYHCFDCNADFRVLLDGTKVF
jgi:hypothetical protein